MISRGDYDARLRLFRYGILVTIIMAFVVVLIAPVTYAKNYLQPAIDEGTLANPSITTFLTQAIIAAVIAAVIGIVLYVIYYYFLKRQLPMPGSGGGAK